MRREGGGRCVRGEEVEERGERVLGKGLRGGEGRQGFLSYVYGADRAQETRHAAKQCTAWSITTRFEKRMLNVRMEEVAKSASETVCSWMSVDNKFATYRQWDMVQRRGTTCRKASAKGGEVFEDEQEQCG